MEEQLHISLTAVFVAVAANFVLGFLWYSVFFTKAWAKELGIQMTGKPPASLMFRGLAFSILGNFFLAYVFAHNIAAWTFVPGMKEMGPMFAIINASLFTWLGFYLPGDLSRVAWEGASWKLFGINTTYHFVMVLIAAVIITYMS